MTDYEKTLRAYDRSRANGKPHLYRKAAGQLPPQWWAAADIDTPNGWAAWKFAINQGARAA